MKNRDELNGKYIVPIIIDENGKYIADYDNARTPETEEKSISERFQNFSGMLEQSPQDKESYKDMAMKIRYVNKLNTDDDYANLNKELDNIIDLFINQQKSKQTKREYTHRIKLFQKYCAENGIEFVQAKAEDSIKYLIYLNEKYAPRTARLNIAALSSFWGFFQRHRPELVKTNIFLKLKIPEIEDKFKKDFPTEKDIYVLCRELKRIERPDITCAVELLYKYGWRCGIFKEMKIEAGGRWSSISKGQKMEGKFIKGEYEKIIKSGVLKLNMNIVSSQITRMTKRLYRDNKITCAFSLHDLRRARMLIEAEEIDIGPLMAFSKKYHKNITTTINYFKAKYGL